MKLASLKPRVRAISLDTAHSVDRDAWTKAPEVKRKLTGRPWRRLRDRIMQRDKHLCQPCLRAGSITQAEQVDHVTPISRGGTDAESNLQAICGPCHEAKTVGEAGDGAASTHPAWLPKPACRVVLVTGPPGAGKSWYCQQHAKPGDTVIDLDECFKAVCGVHGHEADRQHLGAALRLRNKQIANLASKRDGTAYVIVGAPSAQEVEWWCDKLKAEHVLVDPGRESIRARIPYARYMATLRWYQASREPWRKALD